MKPLVSIIIIFNMVLLINTLHFFLFSIIPFIIKNKKISSKKINKKNRFLFIIAARNEEMVLGNLIDSINLQNYDKKLFKICVIPNNCIDNTKKIAIEKKCIVLDPNIEIKTKGDVLNYAFNYFKEDNTFDSYVIFDADNILDKNFLKEMNNKLNTGYKIIQGFRDTKNLYDNYISANYALFFYLQNLFIYESRDRIGESSTLNGTGYVVLKEFIDNYLGSFKTSTEDIELTTICALNNEKVGFNKKAIFYDEQVTDFKTSIKQRKRWIQGSNQVFKKYIKELLLKKFTFQRIDIFQILFLPINQVFSLVLLIMMYIFIIPLNYIILGIILGYIGEVLLANYLILYYKKNIKRLWLYTLFFPIFHISWLPIYIYAFFNTSNIWEEIKHTRALKINEIEDI